MIAAAITSWDGSPGAIEDPDIGTLKIYIKGWDAYNEETKGSLVWTEIKLMPCDSMLNDVEGSNQNSPFFKVHPNSLSDFEKYSPKLKCISPDQNVTLFGNYDTNQGQNLMVVFEKCDRFLRDTCKSEDEI